jgi:hypothetical protein
VSGIKLFAIAGGTAREILGTAVVLETSSQSLIEPNVRNRNDLERAKPLLQQSYEAS